MSFSCAFCSTAHASPPSLCAHCDRFYCGEACATRDWFDHAHYASHIEVKRGSEEFQDDGVNHHVHNLAKSLSERKEGTYSAPNFSIGVEQDGWVLRVSFQNQEDYYAVEKIAQALRFTVLDNPYERLELELYLSNWQWGNRYEIFLELLVRMWRDAHLRWTLNF